MTRTSDSLRARLASLSKEKIALMEALLGKERSVLPDIAPGEREEGDVAARLPASFAQQRLWFLAQLEGGSNAYHVSTAVRMRGLLDPEALQMALHKLVKRHEALRTVFVDVQGEPCQEVLNEGYFPLSTSDLSAVLSERRESSLEELKLREALAPFDLREGPLARARLVRLQSREHVLLLTTHHLVTDGWSTGVLLRDLAELYGAACRDGEAALEPLPIQYADYSQWQRHALQGVALEKSLQYWRTHLEGAAPHLDLPTDRPRPAVQSYRGGSIRVVLNPALTADLRAFAKRNGATLFMVILAGWALLLHRLSGQDDVVVGTPAANRPRPELEGLIGLFVNTLALRVRVRGEMSVGELLQQVSATTLDGFDHQDAPFEKVVEALQPERSPGRNPLFQVMLTFGNDSPRSLRIGDIAATVEDGVSTSSLFDVLLALEERGDRIEGNLSYATDLFERQTVHHWLACLPVLLREMIDEPAAAVGDLRILPETEHRRILGRFNSTELAIPEDARIHDLFERQVTTSADEWAVVHGDGVLTYAELNAKANQLARYLKACGVGPDRIVGLCVERGADMIVGVLGVLKAGGAYLALDPAYPPARLEYMLKDAQPVVVLAHECTRKLIPVAYPTVMLDSHWSQISRLATGNMEPTPEEVSSANLAYLIYTSGSTGQPKGVAIEHRNTVNLICWARNGGEPDVFRKSLHATSLNFDLSVYECFVPLCTGGTVYVVQNAITLAADPLDVTLINTVPSAIQALLDAGRIPDTTRTVNLAGEVLKEALVDRIFAESRVEQICNLYGPSETTTYSTGVTMSRATGFLPSIGRPIANTQVYVLDRRRQAVPIGVVGEIHIGGAGVARGYLNKPELTRERFLPDPFSGHEEGRMYATGDLARWRFDGTLEYLGRNDHQVKIRGFRVEPGEIEAQLLRDPAVAEVAVVAREDVPSEKRLVAYVVPSREAPDPPSAASLRTWLSTRLPEHMVPSAFVMLDRLPLNPNGKLDRKALPAPQASSCSGPEDEPPVGAVEELVAAACEDLLQIQRIGRDDNFFSLGGHSLHGLKLVAHLKSRLGVALPVSAIFLYPTVRAMAAAVQQLVQTQPEEDSVQAFDDGVL